MSLIPGLAVFFAALASVPATAGTTERVVTDFYSGLAMSGFDPVAYFVDGLPREGRDGIEASQDGAIWRFRNVGNRDSFLARPDIYAPQFGGHDPVDVARGVPRPGRPQLWAIVEQRLYLFADDDNRIAFLADAGEVHQAAMVAWPAVEARLAR